MCFTYCQRKLIFFLLLSFSSLVAIVDSEVYGLTDPNRDVVQLFYDSRLIANGYGGVFFAFQSIKSDGHLFIPAAAEKGVNQWVISDLKWKDWLEKQGNHNWVWVENVLEAFQKIVAQHRGEFEIPVVGITGSNGKTIVKEWLSQLIGFEYLYCKSPKSFNSQIGVGISVWNLNQGHNLGIFEAGISQKGEMQNLSTMIQPTLGVMTSFGSAHDEGFGSSEEKFLEKISLFGHSKNLILSDSLYRQFEKLIADHLAGVSILTWTWEKTEEMQKSKLQFNNSGFSFSLPFSDEASLENLGNAISAALFLGIKPEKIQNRLLHLSLPEMRLSLKEGFNGNLIIDDTYTNDFAGLEAALQFASLQRKENQSLVLILSDLQESSLDKESIKSKILGLADNFSLNQLITVGTQFEDSSDFKNLKHSNFQTTDLLMESKSYASIKDSILLIKGARIFKLENLVKILQKKVHGTRLEINLDAMVNNLNFYKSQLPKGTGIVAMVKALGYGSGGEEIARILEYHHVDYLAVAYADEGIKLREAGIKLPIMVLNPMPEAIESMIANNLEPEIYGFNVLKAWLEAAKPGTEKRIPPVHLKIDTGMHRLGFLDFELEDLSEILLQNPWIKIATVFSHLAGADEDGLLDYSKLQIKKFETACTFLKQKLEQNFKMHILNSAGILRFPEANFDMVRLGIGLYGIEINSWFQNQLQSVSTFKTTISQIKKLKAGETVGYGRKGLVTTDSEIATIAIGYADGFRRDFSLGNAMVKVKNQWVPVIGNVCMDMTMVNVTGLNAEEGDEVIIFDNAESLLKLASAAETIPYEILTGIGHRVKRIFYRE